MNKQIFVFLLMLIAVLSMVATTGAVEQHNDPTELSLNQAVELALKQNLNFYIEEMDLQQAEAAYERALLVNDTDMIEEAQAALEKQQQRYTDQHRDLITNVRQMYYDLLQQEATLLNQGKALERAETQFEIDQAKYNAGIISSIDIQRSENSLINAKHNYDSTTIAIETKYMEFAGMLNLDLEQQIILTDQITVEYVPFTMALDDAYQIALDFDQSIKAAKEVLVEAEDNVKAADNQFTPRVELENALVLQEKAEINLHQAKTALYFKIRSDYYNLKNMEDNIHTKKRELELEQNVLQAEEAKYEAGIISNEAIVNQQEKLAQAEDAYTQALWSYSQTRSNFLVQIGRSEPLWGEYDEN